MPLPDFHQMIAQEEYGFLRENEHLGKRIMLLGLSGSYGYGTNREGSDVDFRGIAISWINWISLFLVFIIISKC